MIDFGFDWGTEPEKFEQEFGSDARLKWFRTLGPISYARDRLRWVRQRGE